MKISKKKRKYLRRITFAFLILAYILILPDQLFRKPFCTVITDRRGHLLGAHVAADGQFRFPASEEVPEKFRIALTTFEDKRFSCHLGIDPVAFGRATYQNIKQKRIISGGSTITMQVVRLWREKKRRTIFEKIIEIFWAVRIELSYSKKSILKLYASHAPFGGNVVGLDAAAWRWFGRNASDLTWSESALLAILPNSPALIHLGKNREKLFEKRNRLLKKLYQNGAFDLETYRLSISEPIPQKPQAFPDIAPHLLARAEKEFQKAAYINTTIDVDIQNAVRTIIDRNHIYLSHNEIHNLAALVLEVETGDVVAYVGNVGDFSDKKHGNQVDIITSQRSTGSILKPFLYASMLSEGNILPGTLVFDIPTQINGYAPKNYNPEYEGAVPAKMALARSLNIPAVRMLQEYGLEKFHYKLKKAGLSGMNKPAVHYGLTLILGGCEGSLWDITGIYASMARTLNHFETFGAKYSEADFHPPTYFQKKDTITKNVWTNFSESSLFSASAIWFTFNAMVDVERPENENFWREFESSEKIAWKTGTSFGFRDAWAVGVTPRYVVGVWAGNADGEGRAGLIGIKAAAPVLFEIFDILPDAYSWFPKPVSDMTEMLVCKKSGYLASEICDETEKIYVQKNSDRSGICPFHKLIHIDKEGKFRVNADCETTENIDTKPWFVLPPAVENFFQNKHADYKFLPPLRSDCNQTDEENNKSMAILYPYSGTKIYVPVELDGQPGRVVFEAAHRNRDAQIFWYIDNELALTTSQKHRVELYPKEGKHILTLVDQFGERVSRDFEIINKQKSPNR